MYAKNVASRFKSKSAAVAGAATLVGLGLIAGGGYSAWETHTDAPDSGTITAASVKLDAKDDVTGGSQWAVDMPDALPGSTQTGYVNVTNSGSVALNTSSTLKADSSSDGLEAGLLFTVTESDNAFDGQHDATNDKVVIDNASVDQTGTVTAAEKLDPSTTRFLKIVATVDPNADVSLQGKKAKFNLGFDGTLY